MFDVLRWLIGNTVWFFIIGPALWRGGWPERTVAMINLAGMLLSPVFEYHLSARQLQFNLRVIDSCVTAGFLFVALTSDRWWPLFATAAALMDVATRLADNWVHDISLFMALTGPVIWSYISIFSLAAGIAELEVRRRRVGRAQDA